MGGFGGEGEYGGLGPEPKKDKPKKDKNLTEAVSYIYEDVKDIFSEDIKETKKNQGIMSPTFFDNDDKDDSPPTILENVTNAAKAFMGFFGKANPLLGVAAGITATISGTSVAEQLEKVRKIDTTFDYNKVYNQYLETPKTGLVTIPSRAKTAAAFKGSLSDESMFVPTTLGSFTPPPSAPTGYGAGTDETMFVPTPTGEISGESNLLGFKPLVRPQKLMDSKEPYWTQNISKVNKPIFSDATNASGMVLDTANKTMVATLEGPFKLLDKFFEETYGKNLIINDAIAKSNTIRKSNTSRHFHGDALDISIRGLSNEEIQNLVVLAEKAGFKGFGFGNNILHADTGDKRSWTYTSNGVRVKTFGGVDVDKMIGKYKRPAKK